MLDVWGTFSGEATRVLILFAAQQLRQHAVDFMEFQIQNRAGNRNTEKLQARMSKTVTAAAKPSGKLRCDRIYQNVLLPNGDVVLCCMDWSAEHVLGNLKRDRFEDLYRSETFRRVLRGLKKPRVDMLTYCVARALLPIRSRKGTAHDGDPQHPRHRAGRRPNSEAA